MEASFFLASFFQMRIRRVADGLSSKQAREELGLCRFALRQSSFPTVVWRPFQIPSPFAPTPESAKMTKLIESDVEK